MKYHTPNQSLTPWAESTVSRICCFLFESLLYILVLTTFVFSLGAIADEPGADKTSEDSAFNGSTTSSFCATRRHNCISMPTITHRVRSWIASWTICPTT